MKKHDTLSQKLKSYSALAGVVIAASSVANAQIIYSDTADLTFDTNQTGFSFDLNKDGIFDYTFFLLKYNSGSYINQQVLGFGSNNGYQIAGQIGSSNYVYPDVLNSGDRVGENLSFHPYSSLFWVFGKHIESTSGSYNAGYWLSEEDKFVGLRISLLSGNYYGWLRMSVDSNSAEFIIKDFAYQAIPDSAIEAGDRDTVTAVEAMGVINHLSIYSNNKILFINNSLTGENEMWVQLYDLAGRILESFSTRQKEVKRELPALPEGIYLVRVETAQGVQSKKIMIR